jgi:hypothetical protein
MRLNRFIVFLVLVVLVVLASSAFAEDDKVLFTPDYSYYSQVLKAGEGEGVVWEPTVKSAERITFSKNALRPTEKRTTNRVALDVATVSSVSVFGQTVATPSVEFVVGFRTYRAELKRSDLFDPDTHFFRVEGSDFLSHVSTIGDSVAGEIWLPGNPGKVEHRSIRTRGGSSYLVEWDEEENRKLVARSHPVKGHESETSSLIERVPRRAIAPPREPEVMGPCWADQILTEVVDYMVLFDSTGFSYFISDEERNTYAKNVVATINATIINSQGVGWVRLVGTGLLDYTSKGVLGDDLREVTNSSAATELRDVQHADVVGLFVGAVNSDLGGVTHYYTGESKLGFMVAHVAVAASTPAHEFGHMLGGMGHQPEYWNNPTMPWAYGHLVDGWFGDTMSYPICPNGCGIIPVYSNPHVLAYGKPTGIEGERENWRLIKIAFPVVSKYRVGSQPVCMPDPVRTFGVVK